RVPEGVLVADGVEGVRKAVREQIKYGADWIKFYADGRYYKTGDPRRPLRSSVKFTKAEMDAIVDEAHRLGKKVAAHAMAWDGIDAALTAHVDSIEHGYGLTDDLLDRVVKQNVYWCPTIYVGVWVAQGRGGQARPARPATRGELRGQQRGRDCAGQVRRSDRRLRRPSQGRLRVGARSFRDEEWRSPQDPLREAT